MATRHAVTALTDTGTATCTCGARLTDQAIRQHLHIAPLAEELADPTTPAGAALAQAVEECRASNAAALDRALDTQIAQARAAYDGPRRTYLAAERRLATLQARKDARTR